VAQTSRGRHGGTIKQYDGYQSERWKLGESQMNGTATLNRAERADFGAAIAAAEAIANGSQSDNSSGATFYALPGSSPWQEGQVTAGKMNEVQITGFQGEPVETKHVFRATTE